MKFSIKDVYAYRDEKNYIGGPYLLTQVRFWCPGCNMLHAVTIQKAEGRQEPVWKMSGSGDSLTFSPSIKVTYRHPKGYSDENPAPMDYEGPYVDDICHSFVKEGRIQFLNDCSHSLKNQTVNLPYLPDWSC